MQEETVTTTTTETMSKTHQESRSVESSSTTKEKLKTDASGVPLYSSVKSYLSKWFVASDGDQESKKIEMGKFNKYKILLLKLILKLQSLQVDLFYLLQDLRASLMYIQQ